MRDKTLKDFGKHVREIRLAKNLSQSELASLSQFDRNYIGMLERGERNPSLITLARLAEALDIPLYRLTDFQK